MEIPEIMSGQQKPDVFQETQSLTYNNQTKSTTIKLYPELDSSKYQAYLREVLKFQKDLIFPYSSTNQDFNSLIKKAKPNPNCFLDILPIQPIKAHQLSNLVNH